jgi:hypothetical protein
LPEFQLDLSQALLKLKRVSSVVKLKQKMVATEIALSAVLKFLKLVRKLGHFWSISTVSDAAELSLPATGC